MKNAMSSLFSIIVLVVASSCGSTHKTHGELTKRYETAEKDTITPIEKYISVEGYAFEPDAPAKAKALSVYQLPTSALKKIINAFNSKDSSSNQIIAHLSSPLNAPSSTTDDDYVIDNRTNFSKRLVFSVRNNSDFPADRIWKLTVYLNKDSTSNSMRFLSSSVLATDFANVDVGKLAYNRTSGFDASLNASTGVTLTRGNTSNNGTGNQNNTTIDSLNSSQTTTSSANGTSGGSSITNGIGGNVGYKNTFSTNEEVELKQRYVKLTGSVKANSVSVYQESTSGIDLSGSVIADVDFSPINSEKNSVATQMTFKFRNLKTKKDAPSAVSDVNIKQIIVVYPVVKKDIMAAITFKGVVRQVYKKDNTIAESDDWVKFISGNSLPTTDSILLLSKKEMTPNFWTIKDGSGFPIYIKPISLRDKVQLAFSVYDDAQDFIIWLKEQKKDIEAKQAVLGGNIKMSLETGTLNAAQIDKMFVDKF